MQMLTFRWAHSTVLLSRWNQIIIRFLWVLCLGTSFSCSHQDLPPFFYPDVQMKSLAGSPPSIACLCSTSHSVFFILSYISDTGVISHTPCQPGHPSVNSSAATQLWRELVVVNTSVAFCIGKVWCHRAGIAALVIGFHAQHRQSLTARNGLSVPLGITWPSTASKENILKT